MKRSFEEYREYVCRNCFKQITECTCSTKPLSLIHIDLGMQDIIRLLNEKGYYTDGCCEGHLTKDFDFKHGTTIIIGTYYKVPFIPEGFKIKERFRNSGNYFVYCDIKPKNVEEFFEIQREKLNTLLDWAKKLPVRKKEE